MCNSRWLKRWELGIQIDIWWLSVLCLTLKGGSFWMLFVGLKPVFLFAGESAGIQFWPVGGLQFMFKIIFIPTLIWPIMILLVFLIMFFYCY